MKKEYYGVMALSKMYAQENGVSLKDAEKHIKATFNVIEKALKDKTKDGVQIINKLTIQRVIRKARKGRNPRTKVEVDIPEKTSLKVVVGKELDAELNNKLV